MQFSKLTLVAALMAAGSTVACPSSYGEEDGLDTGLYSRDAEAYD